MFIQDLVTLGVKLEGTPGTPETLAQADYNVRSSLPEYDHNIAEYARKYVTGTGSYDSSIMGKQTGTISFRVPVAGGTAANAWNAGVEKLLNACGTLATAITTVGNRLTPYTPYWVKPVTIEVVEKNEGTTPVQVVTKFAGCMGNCKVVLNEVGQPVEYQFDMQAKFVSVADRAFGSIIVPVFPTTVPVRVLSATCTRNSVVQQFETFTLDFGNQLAAKTQPANGTGIQHFYITGRKPTITCNPYVDVIANDAAYTEWLAGTAAALSFAWGSTGANLFTLAAPVAQYIGLKPAVRNGARVYDKTFLCVKNSATGDDEWSLLQGAAA